MNFFHYQTSKGINMTDQRSKTSAVNGKLGGRPKELLGFKSLPNENWRVVKGFPQYFVSDHGRVISIKSGDKQILKKQKGKRGYHHVVFHRNGERRTIKVHRLVLEVFVGPCPKKMETSHLDGDCYNNHINNLKWDTRQANLGLKREHGTILQGERHPHAKLKEKEVIKIKKSYVSGDHTVSQLATMHRVSFASIYDIINNRTWRYLNECPE